MRSLLAWLFFPRPVCPWCRRRGSRRYTQLGTVPVGPVRYDHFVVCGRCLKPAVRESEHSLRLPTAAESFRLWMSPEGRALHDALRIVHRSRKAVRR